MLQLVLFVHIQYQTWSILGLPVLSNLKSHMMTTVIASMEPQSEAVVEMRQYKHICCLPPSILRQSYFDKRL